MIDLLGKTLNFVLVAAAAVALGWAVATVQARPDGQTATVSGRSLIVSGGVNYRCPNDRVICVCGSAEEGEE